MATFLLEMALDQARIRQRIAERLTAWRESKNLIQPDAARVLGLSARQYQRLEKAQSTPRWRTIEQVAERMEISVADLIGMEELASLPASSQPPRTVDLDDERFERLFAELQILRDGQAGIQAAQESIEKRLDALSAPRRGRASGQGHRSDGGS